MSVYLGGGKLGDERRWLGSGSDQRVHLEHHLKFKMYLLSLPGTVFIV